MLSIHKAESTLNVQGCKRQRQNFMTRLGVWSTSWRPLWIRYGGGEDDNRGRGGGGTLDNRYGGGSSETLDNRWQRRGSVNDKDP